MLLTGFFDAGFDLYSVVLLFYFVCSVFVDLGGPDGGFGVPGDGFKS